MEDLIIKCPNGKERNPKTGRCINNCKDQYTRDKDFKCKKKKTQKKVKEVINLVTTESLKTIPLTKSKTQKKKECPEGKELNPKTNRCIINCKSGYIRDANFKCKKNKTQKKKEISIPPGLFSTLSEN